LDYGPRMDTINLEDRQTGRSATIRRPLTQYLSPDELVALEDVVRDWGNLGGEEAAEETLDRMAAGSPERVLYGLLWLTGVWCCLCQARLGVPLDEFIGGLDYHGLHRDLSGMDEQMWTTSTRLVRRGVLAMVTSDDDVREYLRIIKMLDPALLRIRRHLLTLLDGLTQDMQRNGLGPWGVSSNVINAAGWAPGPALS
jgi:hypothetical protein